jgi:hypothetical protein
VYVTPARVRCVAWLGGAILLDTYGHFMPTESRGFADAIATAPDGPSGCGGKITIRTRGGIRCSFKWFRRGPRPRAAPGPQSCT